MVALTGRNMQGYPIETCQPDCLGKEIKDGEFLEPIELGLVGYVEYGWTASK